MYMSNDILSELDFKEIRFYKYMYSDPQTFLKLCENDITNVFFYTKLT